MEAWSHPQLSLARNADRAASLDAAAFARELAATNAHGAARLAVMVHHVLDRLTTVDDPPEPSG